MLWFSFNFDSLFFLFIKVPPYKLNFSLIPFSIFFQASLHASLQVLNYGETRKTRFIFCYWIQEDPEILDFQMQEQTYLEKWKDYQTLEALRASKMRILRLIPIIISWNIKVKASSVDYETLFNWDQSESWQPIPHVYCHDV